MGIVITTIGVIVAGALAYSLLSMIAAWRYLATPSRSEPVSREPISVLKPLSGLDEGLEENLRGFFEQDYFGSSAAPLFELIFAVRDESDPCVPLVRSLCAEYPDVPSRLILTGEPPYPHAKVYSLARMMTVAKHEIVVMSDSDIRVTRDMLRTIAAEFQHPVTLLQPILFRRRQIPICSAERMRPSWNWG